MHKYHSIMRNKKLSIFILISLILHIIILFIFFTTDTSLKKLFFVKFNKTTTDISLENFKIENNSIELKKNKGKGGWKINGAKTEKIKGRNNPAPEYPEIALKWGYEGTVKLQISINKEGKVYFVKIINSSGYKILDDEAVRTAYQWRFDKPQENIKIIKEIVFKIE